MKHFLLSLFLLAQATLAAPVRDKHVTAELLSEVTTIQAGKPFWVALKLVHDEHWHTYWINDGDSGLPTSITWTLPEGFKAGEIVWPYPQRLEMPPLVSFGYENSAWLLVEITPPDQLANATVELKARVTWLMCKEICIPGRANFSLKLAVGESVMTDPLHAEAFSKARTRIPGKQTDWNFYVEATDTTVHLYMSHPDAARIIEKIELFPIDKDVIASSAEQILEKVTDGYRLSIARENTLNLLPETFNAVLVATPTLSRDANIPSIQINVPFSAGRMASEFSSFVEQPQLGLLTISLFAFIGGLILNLMPCVFPVISLKILGFVQQAGENPKKVWHHGLIFAAGVIVSFWILAGILMALRAGGAGIGWGFQLQSPEVLIVLCLLFFALALNLFGVFEIGLSLTGAGSNLAGKQGWAGSFFSGFLATVIATPCTAPFMGVALGYALTQPPVVGLTVFTSLALGMAFPYLLLSRYPALLKKLPKPGAWMETMKQVMGFFLLATVIWLFWVMTSLAQPVTLVALLLALLLVAIGAWILGKWDTISRTSGARRRARIIGIAVIALGVYAGLQNIYRLDAASSTSDGEWEAFSPERLAELRKEGRPVFIDFTAKWCLTCQVNKLTVLRTSEIMQAFRDRGVTLLYADWTDENEVIAAELASHGRQSVPLYVLYPANSTESPQILPELLTRRIVLDALNTLN
ncbi:MAG TPA: protein-disulfide reductase DsbD family protein [Kiritimatiellia bacterium]|nr:protein-disulfide reductase DsbD family protein [Kiritimatiellia bacterium]